MTTISKDEIMLFTSCATMTGQVKGDLLLQVTA
jgi:hypothetical protein